MTFTAIAPAALVAPAARPITEIVRGLSTTTLTRPTPCADFDVHALLQHLLFYGPALEAAGRKETAAPPGDPDLMAGDWAATLDAQFRGVVAAWGDPVAWDGETRVVGPSPVPAAMVGGMVVGELVVHGWDLGRAVGARPSWDDAVLDYLHGWLESTVGMGRDMGAYGPEVPVPATAAPLDRILGLTGRDPHWTP